MIIMVNTAATNNKDMFLFISREIIIRLVLVTIILITVIMKQNESEEN